MPKSIVLEIREKLEELQNEYEISMIEARHADSEADEQYALGYRAALNSSTEKFEDLLRFVAQLY